ncbi:MAG: hypothetical protein EOO85_25205 [Pedobacter sp.]|nr:MAG: hypothetical protein EOO85_25205 [Pedobacter sp.]
MGKTTFLAALWHVLNNNEIPASLKIHKLSKNREYVVRIWEDWISFKIADRTSLKSEVYEVKMQISDCESKNIAEVTFPDLSGEVFNNHLLDRTWSADFQTLVEQSEGYVFFLHPNMIRNSIRIEDLEGLSEMSNEYGEEYTETKKPFSEKEVPTQIKMVELVQFILANHFSPALRFVFVVSAWDLVASLGLSPENWVERELPLLSQFLKGNVRRFNSKIVGVSAQGADWSQSNKTDKLKELSNASERIEVIYDGAKSNDITLPLRWLLAQEQLDEY